MRGIFHVLFRKHCSGGSSDRSSWINVQWRKGCEVSSVGGRAPVPRDQRCQMTSHHHGDRRADCASLLCRFSPLFFSLIKLEQPLSLSPSETDRDRRSPHLLQRYCMDIVEMGSASNFTASACGVGIRRLIRSKSLRPRRRSENCERERRYLAPFCPFMRLGSFQFERRDWMVVAKL